MLGVFLQDFAHFLVTTGVQLGGRQVAIPQATGDEKKKEENDNE